MAATAIATVFLDRDLRITRFTPSAVDAVQPDPDATSAGRSADLATGSTIPSSTPTPRAVLRAAGADRARGRAVGERWSARAAAALPQRRRPDRRRRPHLRRHHRAAPASSEALRESEALFRTIVTQAAAGVVHIDLDGRITLANARFALIAGTQPRSAGRHARRSRWSTPRTGRATSRRSGALAATARRSRWRCATAQRRHARLGGASVTAMLDAARPADRGDRDRPRRHATGATPSRRCASPRSGCA